MSDLNDFLTSVDVNAKQKPLDQQFSHWKCKHMHNNSFGC